MQRCPRGARLVIETLFSVERAPAWPDELIRVAGRRRRRPFEAAAVELVAALSSHILRSPAAREHPELAALAHWFRKANLGELAARSRGSADVVVRPRGVVFVIAPANVEVLFVYAWLLSLLAGNASVVRVSRKGSRAREAFLQALAEVSAARPDGTSALADSWVITYDHDDTITGRISSVCDARLVWGGDATVAQIRAVGLKPVAVDTGFADRFSFAVFAAERVCRDDEGTLREMARLFANDTLWFAQQACSSPRAVFWIGDAPRIEEARRRFWPLYEGSATKFPDEPASVMTRISDLFLLAGMGAISRVATPLTAFPARAWGEGSLAEVREIHSGHGMFVEYSAPSVTGVAPLMADKDQTVVVYGVDDSEVESLARAIPNRAVDRIVAPGRGNEFSTVWDGSDLLDVLLRKVSVDRGPDPGRRR